MYCSLRLFFASTGSGKKKWFDERELHWPAIKHFLLKKKKKKASFFLLINQNIKKLQISQGREN